MPAESLLTNGTDELLTEVISKILSIFYLCKNLL